MDYYLKAESEQSLWNILTEAGAAVSYVIKDQDGNIVESKYNITRGFDIDIIGTIYKPTGNMIRQSVGDTTVDMPETIAIEGFHANLRGPADLAEKIEYISYQPTIEELADPNFNMPEPEQRITPSPLASLLVYPKAPVRMWF